MKLQDRKNLLNKTALAKALDMSPATLWRVLKNNQEKAKKYNLKECPVYRDYAGGRKYYLADEVRAWIDYVVTFNLRGKH